ncbi:hypothetical protein FOZ60_010207 [Perkinsus olseni]|uniref:Uncharacterized protein n=1 Tax=Perkinsus olseni TaxID=32597 RepID=A0A7J6NG61_PEROL|nr:hypothetical protein FOZ60_010207 [Perkinsus olseni]
MVPDAVNTPVPTTPINAGFQGPTLAGLGNVGTAGPVQRIAVLLGIPESDRVLVEPYQSSNGLRWKRRGPRDRYLKEIVRSAVKITCKSTDVVVGRDGNLTPDIIKKIEEHGWPIPSEDED